MGLWAMWECGPCGIVGHVRLWVMWDCESCGTVGHVGHVGPWVN